MDVADCILYPAVEYTNDYTTTEDWQVGDFKRENTRLVPTDEYGNPKYGGTVSDAALIRYIRELHRRGYEVMLYPKVLLGRDNRKWRGVLKGPVWRVSKFFSNQYNGFIKHYAGIAEQTGAEGFIMGSQMSKITRIMNTKNTYPVVSELVSLAKDVKYILGSHVIVTYAADWTEYHSFGLNYFMDKLWASEYIDVVGINAYFPLTEGPEPTSGYSVQDVIKGWSKGERYDYTVDHEKVPPEKSRYKSKKWAWKHIRKWWSEGHINYHGSETDWQPKMKKIWFTEFGFPGVDGCTNQADAFVDSSNPNHKYPRYSSWKASFRCQKIAIEGTLKKWRDSEMVERMFLYAWDARPYPAFPDLAKVWNDCSAWKTGHWIQGKIGKTLDRNSPTPTRRPSG